jgi:hypothetical protein
MKTIQKIKHQRLALVLLFSAPSAYSMLNNAALTNAFKILGKGSAIAGLSFAGNIAANHFKISQDENDFSEPYDANPSTTSAPSIINNYFTPPAATTPQTMPNSNQSESKTSFIKQCLETTLSVLKIGTNWAIANPQISIPIGIAAFSGLGLLTKTLWQMNRGIKRIEAKLTVIDNKIDNLRTQLKDAESRLNSAIQENKQAILAEIENLKTQIQALSAQFAELKIQVQENHRALLAKIDAVQEKLNDLDALKTKVDQVLQQLSEVNKKVSAVMAFQELVQASVNTAQENLTQLNTNVKSLQDGQESVQASLATQQSFLEGIDNRQQEMQQEQKTLVNYVKEINDIVQERRHFLPGLLPITTAAGRYLKFTNHTSTDSDNESAN